MMTLDEFGHDQFKSDDRSFTFKPVEGLRQTSSTGMIDKKIFTGENKLIAHKEEDTGLWVLKYENGIVPGSFKQRFTSFNMAYKFAKTYFYKRGYDIVEIKDEPKNSLYQRLG